VVGTDLSLPMLDAAAERVREAGEEARVKFLLAPMDHLPVDDATCDLVVAHGIWNLATSGREFRQAVHEAARVAAPGAGLFVFTFSRHTLSTDAVPVTGRSSSPTSRGARSVSSGRRSSSRSSRARGSHWIRLCRSANTTCRKPGHSTRGACR
jgi:ubiquinone/menaquinone biosynthesis C-methylase UbiE